MVRFAVPLALVVLAGCGASDNTIDFRIAGRVLSATDGAGIAGAQVACALDGRSTRTDADGAFRLSCGVPDPGDDVPPVTAVRFEMDGFAPMLKSLPAIDGTTYAAVITLARPVEVRQVPIPVTAAPTTEILDNVTFLFLPGSLVDATGTAATGTVEVALAAWDPSQPVRPNDDPPFLDALLPPFPTHFATTGGDTPYLRPIAATHLAAGDLVPDPERGIDMTITSAYADAAFGGVSDGDNRLFRQDPLDGVFVEAHPGRIDQRNQLTGGIDAPGTWLWVKAIQNATCVDVTVHVGDRPYEGAQLRMVDVDVQDKDQTLVYEAIGTPNGHRCLHGPMGRLVRVEAWLAEGDRLESQSVRTTVSAGGACGECPRTVAFVFPCLRHADCAQGASCIDGTCVPETVDAPDAIVPDAVASPDADNDTPTGA